MSTQYTSGIEAVGVRKTYGKTVALDGLDLLVRPGEVHGLLGPNGAGKTTAIRVFLGLLRHDAGSVSVLGRDPWRDSVDLHLRLAYVPGDVELWPNLTGGEVIDLLTRFRGKVDIARRQELLDRFDLDPTKKSRTYSKGNRQKVAIIAALLAEVDLLILDEPTAGLDPLMEAVFKEYIRESKARRQTVLLSSHILAQVEELCDRISIIRQGRVVESGSLADLRHLTRTTVMAHTTNSVSGLDTLDGIHDLEIYDHRVKFSVDGEHLDAAMRRLTESGIRSLTSHPPTLEQLLLRHYEKAESR